MPLDSLSETYGWDVAHGVRFPNVPKVSPDSPHLINMVKRAVSGYDVVIAQRTCQPAATKLWHTLKGLNVYRVYEIDDNLFSLHRDSNPIGYDFYNRPEIRKNLRDNISAADVVTVSTEPLAEIMSQMNPNVKVCPNAVPDGLLERQIRRASGKVVIGWGGSSTHAMDFAEVRDSLKQLFRRRDDIEFHVIGADYISRYIPIRHTPWFPSITDYYNAVDYDIGIAPLRPHVFNQSKSYIKALELAALGIPVVASDVGPYRDFVRHGETGFLVKQAYEWNKYLHALIDDVEMRREMGMRARELAASYTVSVMAPIWKSALTPE